VLSVLAITKTQRKCVMRVRLKKLFGQIMRKSDIFFMHALTNPVDRLPKQQKRLEPLGHSAGVIGSNGSSSILAFNPYLNSSAFAFL